MEKIHFYIERGPNCFFSIAINRDIYESKYLFSFLFIKLMFNQSNENNNKSSINEIMQFVPLKNVMQSQNVD